MFGNIATVLSNQRLRITGKRHKPFCRPRTESGRKSVCAVFTVEWLMDTDTGLRHEYFVMNNILSLDHALNGGGSECARWLKSHGWAWDGSVWNLLTTPTNSAKIQSNVQGA